MADTFAFDLNPQYGASSAENARIFEVGFGDGYIQRGRIGITPVLKEWDLTFYDTKFVIIPIYDFLVRHKGTDFFYWEDPLGDTKKYVSTSWNISVPHFNSLILQTKFMEVVDNG